MTHFLHSVQRLPQELVRKVADELVGIKEWVTIPGKDPPPPTAGEYYSPEPPLRKIDFVGLRTMPSLATVCHIFLEPTLDALWPWATLPDYGILVYLLPKDAWAVDVIDDMGDPFLSPEERSPLFQYVSIVRSLTEEEFERLEYYTPRGKRIQELCPLFPSRFQGSVTYESSVLAAFAPRWTPERPIFPNLRILDISPANDQYSDYYRVFHVLFGPQLRRLSNDCVTFARMARDVDPADYQQMLVKLQESAPNLLHLKLYVDVPPYSPVVISAMSTAIRSFKHLISARIGSLPITKEALHHLAELPHREVVDVRLPDTMTERDVASLHPTRFDEFFPALRELRLAHHFNLDVISRIVQHVHSSRLEIIRAVLEIDAPLTTILPFLSVIRGLKNSDHIKHLSIQASIGEEDGASPFTKEHLEPLFRLKSLTHLRLHLCCTFHFNDADLERVGRAWPNIRVLELGPNRTQKDTQATLSALVPFAQHCPELHTLGFTLDADLSRLPADLRESRTSVGSVQRALQVLKVGRARITDAEAVSKFLIDLFPRLDCIQNDNPPSVAVVLAGIDGGLQGEIAAGAKCHDLWQAVYENWIPALARERGIDRESSIDERDAYLMKSWQMGGRRRRAEHPT